LNPYASGKDWTLYHGDCREILPRIGSVDAVVTDPPYGIKFAGRPTKWSRDNKDRQAEDWDDTAPEMAAFLDLGVPAMIWGGNHFALPPSRGWLVWVKPKLLPTFGDAELCWTNIQMPVRHRYEGLTKDREHPTQKPIGLMMWCVSFAPEGCTVLDPYTGSGTTGVACIRTGRKFIGIELDEGYCEIAAKRMAEAENHLFRSL